ncbi:glycosyltransferase [Streptomyces sp. NPDC005907]|uniref:glycosyltransferase n=1 Tax=Streptomyces sp. NPDC005907 TaxID=3154571 RepID=UPI00340F3DBC
MIGYYVHHHGRGHLHRAVCIARHTGRPVTGLSSLPRPADWPGPWVRLPLDTGGPLTDVTANGRLHWAPVGHDGYRERMRLVADWITRARPSLLVSDVSVEVAGLGRLLGVPVVVAAMRGDRRDPAHTFAYDLARGLLAPWPAELPEPGWPEHWYAKTLHAGAFSRHDDRPRTAGTAPSGGRRRVLVMLGAGGGDIDDTLLAPARRATPDWEWTVLGGGGTWAADPWPPLCAADVVVTHGGQNALAECAAARRPAVVIPQDRPFGEQSATGRALAQGGIALVRASWPTAREWPDILSGAVRLGGAGWARWSYGDGARRAASFLDRLAGSSAEEASWVA